MSDTAADEPEAAQRRFDRGMEALGQLDRRAGQSITEMLADISPELGRQIIGWGFGEIYCRPQLQPRERQLLTLGILTALGDCTPQLNTHIRICLNLGLTPEEIVEALLHSAVYCGIPKALNATLVAKEVFSERGLLPVTP